MNEALSAEVRRRVALAVAVLVLLAGGGALRAQQKAADAESALVKRLEAIRQRRVMIVDGKFYSRTAEHDYAAVFKETGLGVVGDNEEAMAIRVRASGAAGPLAAALDDWALATDDPKSRAWLLGVARRADPDPWRDRFRDPAVWKDGKALAALAEEALRDNGAKLRELSPQLLAALGQLLGGGARAVPLLRAAQRRHPGDFWINLELGNALSNVRQLGEAVAYYRVAMGLRPDAATAHNNLGAALHADSRLDEAIAEFRRAIELDPRLANAHSNLGRALVDQGNLNEGVAACRGAIRLDPGLVTAHTTLGLALYKKGDLDGAIAELRKAIELDPRYATAHGTLGDVLRAGGRLDEAVAEYRKAIALDRRFAPAYSSLGLALAAKKNGDGAAAAFRKAVELDPRQVLVLAAAAQGKDAKDLPDDVRLMLRRQALAWLRDGLAPYTKLAERDATARRFVRQQLARLREDPDLAPLRDKAALEKLPEDQRAAWRALWADVDALLLKVKGKE